jgi:alcohol dehydrogenase, propanol-preferring
MRAMILDAPRTPSPERSAPLREAEVETPTPGRGEVLIRVAACAVCRTDLHIIDGELPRPKLPLVPGHEIAGTVAALGEGCTRATAGMRVGVPWLAWTCQQCRYCLSGQENLCDRAQFTGYDRDGGYAEYTVADERFIVPLPSSESDAHAAPLLCAGLIGYRALTMAGEAERIGLFGFGAAAHIIAQVARYQGRRVHAFTRANDAAAQNLARSLGAVWAGGSDESPPEPLDAAIIFAPVGALVPVALERVRKGGVVVCGGIHMSDIPTFRYELLWGERVVRSVANLTRKDAEAFFELAPKVPVRTEVHEYRLTDANRALDALRTGRFTGAAVLVPR